MEGKISFGSHFRSRLEKTPEDFFVFFCDYLRATDPSNTTSSGHRMHTTIVIKEVKLEEVAIM